MIRGGFDAYVIGMWGLGLAHSLLSCGAFDIGQYANETVCGLWLSFPCSSCFQVREWPLNANTTK